MDDLVKKEQIEAAYKELDAIYAKKRSQLSIISDERISYFDRDFEDAEEEQFWQEYDKYETAMAEVYEKEEEYWSNRENQYNARTISTPDYEEITMRALSNGCGEDFGYC